MQTEKSIWRCFMRKFGVIGGGNRGSLIRAVMDFPDWQLAALADIDPARADKFKEFYPEAKFTTNYRDLLADPEICASFDMNKSLAATSRKKILALAAKKGYLIAGAHIPFPGTGKVEQEGNGFYFTAAKE